jgi:hypothetical protein
MLVAGDPSMKLGKHLTDYARGRMTRRLTRTMPWIGGLIALLAIRRTVRRKGLFGGTLDTVLDAVPFVGAAKNIAEAGRGRDFISDRR